MSHIAIAAYRKTAHARPALAVSVDNGIYDLDAARNAGLKLGEQAGYIDVRDKDMLVHTPMAKHGDTAEVTFTAPEPGTYPYICTVPGHYMLMKGLLTVIP